MFGRRTTVAKLDKYDFNRAINTAVAVLRGKSTAVSPKTARATLRLAFEQGYIKSVDN